MKRLALAAALVSSLVACGSGNSSSVVLQPKDPLAKNVYIKVTGSSDAASAVAAVLEQGGGVVAASATKGSKDCAQAFPIVTYPVTVSSLRGLAGQKVTLAFYGSGAAAAGTCHGLSGQFPNGIPLVGGNRRIYHMPSSSMQPTLNCAKAAEGCLGKAADTLVTQLTGAARLERLAIVAFTTPPTATSACGEGGTFVKRIIGLPGEAVREDGKGFIWIRLPGSKTWVTVNEPYVSAQTRALDSAHFNHTWSVPHGTYFVLGDNRSLSCDSRAWGPVPVANIIGPVVQIIRNGAVLKPAGPS
jgi:signal peptidase I